MLFDINLEEIEKEYLKIINRQYKNYLILKELFKKDIERKYFEECYSELLKELTKYYNLFMDNLDNEEYFDKLAECMFFIKELNFWHVYDYMVEHNLIKGKLNKSSKTYYTKKNFLKLKDKIFNKELTDKEILNIAKHFYLIKVFSNEILTEKEEYAFDKFLRDENIYIYNYSFRRSFYFDYIRYFFINEHFDKLRILLIEEFFSLKELYEIQFIYEIPYINLIKIFKCIYAMTIENYIYLKNNNNR